MRFFYFLTALAAFGELLAALGLWSTVRATAREESVDARRGFFADAARDCFLTLRALGFREAAVAAGGWRLFVAAVVLLPFAALLFRTPAWLQVVSGVGITALVLAQVAFLRRAGRRLLPIFFYPLGWVLLVADPARAAKDPPQDPSFER